MNLFFGSFKSVLRKANLFVMNAVSENVLDKSVAKNGERLAESAGEEWRTPCWISTKSSGRYGNCL